MRSGQLRQYATIEQWTVTGTGSRGQDIASWQTLYATVPMQIDELSGRQLELARQQVATATHKVTLRFQPGILPEGCRINFTDPIALTTRYFNIESVGEFDFRFRYLTLLVMEQKTGLP